MSTANYELKHLVRYYTSWFESLSHDELENEMELLNDYYDKKDKAKNLSNVDEEEDSCEEIKVRRGRENSDSSGSN